MQRAATGWCWCAVNRRAEAPADPAQTRRFPREWQLCNINVMVDAASTLPHPYITINVRISTSRQKKIEKTP